MSLFEVELDSGQERQLSERRFERGVAFYDGDHSGYYLQTSNPLVVTTRRDETTSVAQPRYSEIDRDEQNPFNGYYLQHGQEIEERPTSIIPSSLFAADRRRGSHATLQDVDYQGQLVISYVYPDSEAAFGENKAAVIVAGGEIVRRVDLDGARLEEPRISGDGQTLLGLVGAQRVGGANQTFPGENRPFVFVSERNGVRSYFTLADVELERDSISLQPHRIAEIV